MMNVPLRRLLQLVAALTLAVAPLRGATSSVTVRPPMLFGGLAVNRTHVVFSWGGDLWRVERAGGEAQRLTTDPGEEEVPVFSPDGSQIAFSRQTGGNWDVWVMQAAGGEARRLTWHPKDDFTCGWSPDGKAVLFSTNREGDGLSRLYSLPSTGGFETALPLPEGAQASYSPDGSRLAYVPFMIAPERWRFYRGGMTSPIRIARLAGGPVEKRPALSRPDANHRSPLWIGETLYFVSDAPGVANLFALDLKTGKARQLTELTRHGILTAAAAPDAVAFVAGGEIHLYDLAGGGDRTLDLRLTTPAPELSPRTAPALRTLESAVPAGDNLLLTTRGEVIAVDPRTGLGRNLTRTPAVAERSAVPSPDGRWIAYFSDASGEYELHVRPAAGDGEVRRIAIEERPSFYREPVWSPDGRRIAFSDKRLALWIADLEAGKAQRIATSPHIGQDLWHPTWSPDGRWLAYSQALANRVRTVFLWDAAAGRAQAVTDGETQAEHPAFDRSGRYLYFTTSSNARAAAADDLDWGVMSSSLARPLVTRRLNALVLRQGDPAPLLPVLGQPHPAARWEPAAGEVGIDLAGMERRIVQLGGGRRDVVGLAAGRPGVLFVLVQEWPAAPGAGDAETVLYRADLTKGSGWEKLASEVEGFALSAGGGTLLYSLGGSGGPALVMAPADTPAEAERKPLGLAGLTVEVDPAAEWRQMHREAWRLARDWFYDPGFHGQDLAQWESHFATYLPGITRRADLNELFRQMLGSLSVSHLGVRGGDMPPPAGPPSERTGLLGADFVLDQNRSRITRIYRSGHPTAGNPLLRAPLDQPGVDVREGDYLLAVDGVEITADRNLFSFFTGKAGKAVEIKVSADPGGAGARTATVVAIPGENGLRRANWAMDNKRRVAELSGGRLAYVHLPDHGFASFEDLQRVVLGSDAEGIIVDQRWSGGGIVYDAAIELLRRRPLYAYAWREGADLPLPTNASPGARALIVNRSNASAAETFALMWKLSGLGPIVGTRTFGGGIGGALFTPDLVDGGGLTIPNRAAYDPNGTWGIENDGVHPDVEVEIDPDSWRAGRDPQLEAAVKAALAALPEVAKWAPKRPAYPKYP